MRFYALSWIILPWIIQVKLIKETAPRIRGGDPAKAVILAHNHPLLPAYAGVILAEYDLADEDTAAPRIRGGDPITAFYIKE